MDHEVIERTNAVETESNDFETEWILVKRPDSEEAEWVLVKEGTLEEIAWIEVESVDFEESGPIDFGEGKQSLIEVASLISDRDYQERAWFGRERGLLSSPSNLEDDFFEIVDDFLEQHSHSLSSEERDSLNLLASRFGDYEIPRGPWPTGAVKVIDDPRWELVREAALAFVEATKQTVTTDAYHH